MTVTCGNLFLAAVDGACLLSLTNSLEGRVRNSRRQSLLCLASIGNFSAKVPRPWRGEMFVNCF